LIPRKTMVKTKRINLMIDSELDKRIEEIRKDNPLGYSALIEGLLEQWCTRQEVINKILSEPENARRLMEGKKNG